MRCDWITYFNEILIDETGHLASGTYNYALIWIKFVIRKGDLIKDRGYKDNTILASMLVLIKDIFSLNPQRYSLKLNFTWDFDCSLYNNSFELIFQFEFVPDSGACITVNRVNIWQFLFYSIWLLIVVVHLRSKMLIFSFSFYQPNIIKSILKVTF